MVQAAAARAAGRRETTLATGAAGRRLRRTTQVATAQTSPTPADSHTVGWASSQP